MKKSEFVHVASKGFAAGWSKGPVRVRAGVTSGNVEAHLDDHPLQSTC